MKRVFGRVGYVAFALGVGTAAFLSMTWIGALGLVSQILADDGLPLPERFRIVGKLLALSLADLGISNSLYILLVSLLLGVNVSLLAFYLRMYRSSPSSTTISAGLMGSVAAFFGFGCAACGSVFLLSLTATLGGSSLLVALPYQGMELSVVGMLFLVISAYLLARAINKPPVCPI